MKHLISLLFATSLVASEYHGTFFADTLTVTNALYLGDANSQTWPEIRIPNSGTLDFRNVSGSLFTLNQYGEGDFTGDVRGYNIYAQNNLNAGNYLHVANTIDLGNGNTTLTAANYGSLSVGSGTASGAAAFACGFSTASGTYSHAEGNNTTASGESSHAEGYQTTCIGNYSHTEGWNNQMSGFGGHVEGALNYEGTSGGGNHIEGLNNTISTGGGFANHIEGQYNSATTNVSVSYVGGSQAHADHDRVFLWSDGNELHSSTDHQFSVAAQGGIRFMISPVTATNGFSSSAPEAVNGAATGWTNTLGKNSFVAVDGFGITYKLYNSYGTVVYTNASLNHDFVPVQDGGKIIILGGASVKLRALGF